MDNKLIAAFVFTLIAAVPAQPQRPPITPSDPAQQRFNIGVGVRTLDEGADLSIYLYDSAGVARERGAGN